MCKVATITKIHVHCGYYTVDIFLIRIQSFYCTCSHIYTNI